MTNLMHNVRLRTLSALLSSSVLVAACSEKPTAEASLAEARKRLAAKDYRAVVVEAKNALQISPNLREGRYLLGVGLVRTGDPVGGEAELGKALSLGQPAETVDPPWALSILAQRQYQRLISRFSKTRLKDAEADSSLRTSVAAAYFLLGNVDDARAALATALEVEPGNAAALLLQAQIQAASGDRQGALAGLDALLARDPTNTAAWKIKGDLLAMDKAQLAPALFAYRKAAETKPGDTALKLDILTVLLRQGDLDEASRQADQLKKVAPNLPRLLYLETLLAMDKKDFQGAQALARQLVVLAPSDPANLLIAGDVDLSLNALPQAEANLKRALELAPLSEPARLLLAGTYLRSRQTAKALETLQPLLAKTPPATAAMKLAAEVYRQSGDRKNAEAWYAKASKQDPNDKNLRRSLVLEHLANGGGPEALQELRDVAGSDTGTSADLALIANYVAREDYEAALAAIDALEKKQPGKPLASNLRGRVQIARKDYVGARASFDRALALDPDYFVAIDGLAAVDLAEKNPSAARARFEAYLAKNPSNVQALISLANLLTVTGAKPEEVSALFKRAIAADPADRRARLALIDFYLRVGDHGQALATAQDAMEAFPDSPQFLDALGRARQANGNIELAITSFTRLATMQPKSALPQMRLAGAYLQAKDKSSAMASLRRALAIQPDYLDAQRSLIALAGETKDSEEARDLARTVQRQRPKDTVGYLFEGELATSHGESDKAFEVYQRGLAQIPSPDLARRAHAALMAAKKTAEAAKFASTWLTRHPDDAVFLSYLGDVSLTERDFAGAEKRYLRVVQLQPKDATAYNNLAWISGQLKHGDAIGLAQKANALVPDQPAYLDTLAELLAQDKQYDKALEVQTRAVSLQPQNSGFRLNLARIQILDGKKDLARAELQKLASLGDSFRGQTEVTRLLKTL
jgi:cellulose synthase operon protein C